MNKIKINKTIHIIYKEKLFLKKKYKSTFKVLTSLVGKYLYTYTSNKGKITLITIPKNSIINNKKIIYEIYSCGTLFNDVERFSSKKQAERRIFSLLK